MHGAHGGRGNCGRGGAGLGTCRAAREAPGPTGPEPGDQPSESPSESPPAAASPVGAPSPSAAPSSPSSSPSATTVSGSSLDARRQDLRDDLVGIGQQRHVARDRQVGDLDDGVEVDQRLDRVLDRLGQVIRQRLDADGSSGWRSVPFWSSTARRRCRSRQAERRRSAPRSSGPGTDRRGAAGGSPDGPGRSWTRTGREASCRRPRGRSGRSGRRAGGAVRTRGRRARRSRNRCRGRRRRPAGDRRAAGAATFLPVTVRGSAARVGRVGGAVDIGMGPRLMVRLARARRADGCDRGRPEPRQGITSSVDAGGPSTAARCTVGPP